MDSARSSEVGLRGTGRPARPDLNGSSAEPVNRWRVLGLLALFKAVYFCLLCAAFWLAGLVP